MDSIFEGFKKAFELIISIDPELVHIIARSFQVSGFALVIASLIGVPLGAVMALQRIPVRGLLMSILNTCMGLPPVVVGLFVYLLLSRSGPLGFMALLYSPTAMIVAQTILAFPIVASLSYSAIASVNPLIRQTALTLGAAPMQVTVTVINEARFGIMSAVIAAFGRVIAEVGAILIVGGNIAGYTRVMTTAIALETDKGNFELALALGTILLTLSLVVNTALHAIQKRGGVASLTEPD